MTSSLVGSEMCIRDRCAKGAQEVERGMSAFMFAENKLSDNRVVTLFQTCLLYTSDAADDM
eukprot:1108413-Prorocentrum_lima.AAC.1